MFHFGHKGLETPKPSKFAPQKKDLAGNKRWPHLGAGRRRKETGRMQTWGQEEGAAPTSYGTNFLEVLGVSRPL